MFFDISDTFGTKDIYGFKVNIQLGSEDVNYDREFNSLLEQ